MIERKTNEPLNINQKDFDQFVKQKIQQRFGNSVYQEYFGKSKYIAYNQALCVLCPTSEATYTLSRYYHKDLATLAEILWPNRNIKVNVQHDPSINTNNSNHIKEESEIVKDQHDNILFHNFEAPHHPAQIYSFENFIEDSSNTIALAISRYFAGFKNEIEIPDGDLFFLHGNVGHGKTHLAKSIFHSSRKKGIDSVYFSSEEFTSGFISAIRNKTVFDFKAGIMSKSLIIIDDVHCLRNRSKTIAELSSIIFHLLDRKSKIVLTSALPASEFEHQLRSRISSGISAKIGTPGLELKRKIAQTITTQKNIPLSVSEIDFLIKNISGGLRELKGAINRLSVEHSLHRTEITKQAILQIVPDLMRSNGNIIVTNCNDSTKKVQKATAAYFSISPELLLSKSRKPNIVYARNLAMYICRIYIGMPFEEIAERFNRNSHSAVIFGIKSLTKLISENEKTKADLSSVRRIISGLCSI